VDRLHLFEFHDQPWVPAVVRDSVVESLGRTTAWSRLLQGLVLPLRSFLGKVGRHELLELCSGSGAMARLWLDEFARQGLAAPDFLLSDLFPRVRHWRELCKDTARLSFSATPVDAAQVPPDVGSGRPRLIANALHHFEPDAARAVLHDALEHGGGIFVCENFGRSLRDVVGPALVGVPALLANPLLTGQDRLLKALCTWLIPVAPLAFAWDGVVSSVRVYTPEELRAMTERVPGVEWTFGEFEFTPFGRGRYAYAVRRP
jgi:hypothetical protein